MTVLEYFWQVETMLELVFSYAFAPEPGFFAARLHLDPAGTFRFWPLLPSLTAVHCYACSTLASFTTLATVVRSATGLHVVLSFESCKLHPTFFHTFCLFFA